MSYKMISSDLVPMSRVNVKPGQHISWHMAVFKDLMTEKSSITYNTFLTGKESGITGYDDDGRGFKWLLKKHCLYRAI